MAAGATDFINFLQLFISVYPEYASATENRQVYLAGWDYAGKYIPLFSSYITQWKKTATGPTINYVGALIGNPVVAPAVQATKVYQAPQSLDILDQNNLLQIQTLWKNCEQQISKNWTNAATVCDN